MLSASRRGLALSSTCLFRGKVVSTLVGWGANASVVLPAFYVSPTDPDRLYASYFLSYEDGTIDSHVVRLARRFAGAFLYGARTIDEPVLH